MCVHKSLLFESSFAATKIDHRLEIGSSELNTKIAFENLLLHNPNIYFILVIHRILNKDKTYLKLAVKFWNASQVEHRIVIEL